MSSEETSPTYQTQNNSEPQGFSEHREITPIPNNPADCDHYFEIIDSSAREIICKKCPFGSYFRLGKDLDELRDGKPYLKGKPVIFKTRKIW